MKKFLNKLIDNSIAVLAGVIISGGIAFTVFSVNVYTTVSETVPLLSSEVSALQDTIKRINKRPAQIERKVGLMEKDVETIQRDVGDIKKMQAEQRQINQQMYQLLIEIKNGNK